MLQVNLQVGAIRDHGLQKELFQIFPAVQMDKEQPVSVTDIINLTLPTAILFIQTAVKYIQLQSL